MPDQEVFTCDLCHEEHPAYERRVYGDTEAMREAAIARILFFVENHWHELLRFSRRTRSQMEQWAARYGRKDNPKEQIEHVKNNFADRYRAVNLTNASTIEFRMFRGTLRYNTIMRAYSTAVNRIHKDEFGKRKINTVKPSDAKGWLVKLHDAGFKRNTIEVMQSVIRPAFEMAVDDDIVILLETGLRVSELYGLTKSDVDMKNRRISIRRQLCRTAEKAYFVTAPKTKSGIRSIPLSDAAYFAFARVIQNRRPPKVEMIIDGCTGFLFLDKNGKPKVAMHLQNYMKGVRKRYAKKYGNTMPAVTPHVLRHTFCTNLQPRIDVKSLQYLMGHSNASMTLDVYTHSDYDTVERAFREAMKLA